MEYCGKTETATINGETHIANEPFVNELVIDIGKILAETHDVMDETLGRLEGTLVGKAEGLKDAGCMLEAMVRLRENALMNREKAMRIYKLLFGGMER